MTAPMTVADARPVVSFLFCDQVGSTAVLEQLGEAANDELRRDLFAALRRPIDVFGGIEVKNQGDGFMVAFPRGPDAAVACAVAMQRAASGLAGRDRRVLVAIRVGVAAGEATVEDGDYYGRAVVEAARLCAAAQPGQILATEAAADLLDAELAERARSVGALLLKGFAEPVPSVSVEWSHAEHWPLDESRPMPAILDPSALLPFVGRADSLEVLAEAWERAAAGLPAVVTLSGVAGTGKSRLVAEAAHLLVGERGAVALAGSARDDPLVDALRWWARASSPDEVHRTFGSLAPAVAARIPAVALQIPSVALQRPPLPEDPTDDPIDPVVAGLVAVAARTPLLLLVDDAEALTPAAGSDVAALIGLAPGGVMVVLSYREVTIGSPLEAVLSKIDHIEHARSLSLPPWGPDESVIALTAVIPALDRTTAQVLHEAAGGNPARVTEFAAAARSGLAIEGVVASVQPFKGLVPYRPGDGDVFFGRGDDVAVLVERLATRRLLTVTGPSGAGKSSLVLAGLLPALARGALPGSEHWPVVVVEASRDDPEAVMRAIDALPPIGNGVLVVDQAEELLPTSVDDVRHDVVDRLLGAIADPDRAVRAILALRADRYGDVTVHPALARAVERDNVLVGPLRPDQLIGVVNGPAHHAGLRVESGLAELVVADAAAEPGALPLVSHALRETWRRRRGSILTISDYRESGGVRGAIASTADELVLGLDAEGQRLVRALFVELAEITPTGEPVRRRLTRATIPDLIAAPPHDVDAVLERVIDARLVVSDGAHVQVAHEALLREWPRLRTWLEEDRELIRRRRAVADQAADWELGGRQPSDLLGGVRLELARDDLALSAGGWTASARDYVEQSVLAREAAREGERRQLEAERRSNRRLRVLLGAVGLLLVAAVVAGAVATNARQTAVDAADRARTERARADDQATAAEQAAAQARAAARIADARRLTSQSAAFVTDPQLELLTAVEAVRVESLPATEARLLSALTRTPGVIRFLADGSSIANPPSFDLASSTVSFSALWAALLDDGHAGLVVGNEVTTWQLDGAGLPTVRRWPEIARPTAIVRSVAGFLVADGSTVAVLRADDTVGGRIAFPDPVQLLAGSPSGTLAAVGFVSGEVALVDLSDPGGPRLVRTVRPAARPAEAAAEASRNAIAVADDGRLALLSGSTIWEWDPDGAELPVVPTPGSGTGLAYLGGELVQQVDGTFMRLADLPPSTETSGISITAPSGSVTDPPVAPDLILASPPPPSLVTIRTADGVEHVVSVSGSRIVWSDSGEASPAASGFDPGLGFLTTVAVGADGRTALVVSPSGVALVALDGRTSLDVSRVPLGAATFTSLVRPSVSPDGSRLTLLTGALDTLTSQVVDLATGAPIGPPVPGRAGFRDDDALVSGSIEPDGLLLRNIDAVTGVPFGDETSIPGFSPTDLVAEDAAAGRIVLAGTFGADPTIRAVLVDRNTTPSWRTLDEVEGFDAIALRPGYDDAWATRAGVLLLVDLARLTVEQVTIAGIEPVRLAFSGDGATLFVSAANRVLSLDVAQPEPDAPTLLAALTSDVIQLTADATGAKVAVNVGTGRVLLDSATGETFAVGGPEVQQVAFLPSGDLLVIDGTAARVIGLNTDRLVTIACNLAGRVQTPEEWQRYGPQDAPYAPACAQSDG